MMLILFWTCIIYLSGALITYLTCRLIRNILNNHNPEDKEVTALMTTLSWVGFMIIVIAFIDNI